MSREKGVFPGSPVVKTSPSNAGGEGSVPGQGTKIPHTLQPKNPKQETEAILSQIQLKTFLNGLYKKESLRKKRDRDRSHY